MVRTVPDRDGNATLVDDCWNRIGTRGDSSCPQLAEHMRCVECPVFEQAAAMLLERMSGDVDERGEQVPSATAPHTAATQTAFVFRVGQEWLALPAASIDRIGEVRPIHSLPHRRDPVVLGLVNVRGALTIAASLTALLNLSSASAARYESRNPYARLLVATHRGEPAAFPVDEAQGIIRFCASDLMPVPATLAQAAASHARGVLAWRDTTIGLLDVDRVFDSLAGRLR